MKREKKRGSTYALLVITIVFLSLSISAQAIIDSDHDRVSDSLDKCSLTPLNSIVDQNGCSLDQFCNQYLCGDSCDLADWRNDEPNQDPFDCRTAIVKREGSLRPICVPLNNTCQESKPSILQVPSQNITILPEINSPVSYWNISLFGVPSGFGPINDTSYLGWCAEKDVFLQQNQLHNATLYSSYDPNLSTVCPKCFHENWTKINYLLNNKDPSATVTDIQDAIWYLLSKIPLPSDPQSQSMIHDAEVNGTNFIPQRGDYMAIIINTGQDKQLTFIEVDP